MRKRSKELQLSRLFLFLMLIRFPQLDDPVFVAKGPEDPLLGESSSNDRAIQAREKGGRPEARCLVRQAFESRVLWLLTARRSIVNEAAIASPVQPIVNMGQGFFGYNPPSFVIDAAKQALDQVDCNQYSPTKVGGCMWWHRHERLLFKGPTSIKEGSCQCLFTILRTHY